MQPGVDANGRLVLPRAAQQHLAAAPRRERARLLAKACRFVCESLMEGFDLLEASTRQHGACPSCEQGGSATPALSLPIDAE
jgi:hypothetical protein